MAGHGGTAMKAGSCATCSHPQRAEIDQAHIGGATVRDLAKRFDRSRSSMQRHVKEHIPSSVQKAIEAAESRDVAAGDTVLAKLLALSVRANRLLDAAEKKHDYRTAISAVREITRQLELEARLIGELQEKEISLNVHLDASTLKRMAETYLARLSKPAITVQAKQIVAGNQPVVTPQVIENESAK